jgi:hypothetical protein
MNAIEEFFTDVAARIEKEYRPPPGELTPCTQLLVADLQAARTDENANAVDQIIRKAKEETYHEFLSELDMPLTELAAALRAAGLLELEKAVDEGKYDA